MILATHAIVGASLSVLTPFPWLSPIMAFISHLLIDTIPHTDYSLRGRVYGKESHDGDIIFSGRRAWLDIIKIGFDATLGFAAVWYFFGGGAWFGIAIVGAFFGILPDALQYLYFKFRRQPLLSLQKFHIRIQRHTRKYPAIGVVTQCLTVILFLILVHLFLPASF